MKKIGSFMIKIFTMFVCLIAMSSCIHTYPDGDGIDPTLVQIGVEVTLDISWKTNEVSVTKSSDLNNDFEYRLIIEFARNSIKVGRCEHYITPKEYEQGSIKLIMPFDFHAVNYEIMVWLDCIDAESHLTPAYDVTSLSKVTRSDKGISWSMDKECAYCHTEINLQQYKDNWNAKVIVPLKLTTPLGRIRIIANDMAEFRDYVAKPIEQGEKYTACLSFESRIGMDFNISENMVTNYLESSEFYFPITFSDKEIASGAIFVGEKSLSLEARILVYNSARMIVSKSPTIQFPIKRGKITEISGDLLTNYFTNNITVDNIWEGEIIIEL